MPVFASPARRPQLRPATQAPAAAQRTRRHGPCFASTPAICTAKMDQRTRLLIYVGAAQILLQMMAMIITSRKRKRAVVREPITYGPIDERDRIRIEYLNNKIWRNDTTCVNMLRLTKPAFFRFCQLFKDRGLLQDTIHMCVEQQVAMFLNTVGHNLRNRLVGTNFDRSGETVSRYFNRVLHAIGELRSDYIRPPSLEIPTKIAGNPRYDPYFKETDMDASDQQVGQGEASGHVVWTVSMSSFMLSHLAGVVANGTRTSSGFKKVHLNSCARALNDHFKMRLTGEQIGHHVRTWKRKYAKICGLMRISGALWDEDTYTINLDHEHYTGYIATHKTDAEYLNKPIEHYSDMLTIFGNSLATGKFAKESSEALGTADNEGECDEDHVSAPAAATPEDNSASSSAPKPKRLKTSHNEEEAGLVVAFKGVGQLLADAICESATAATDVPPDLYATLQSLPGFDDSHVDDYFDYFVEHPSQARAFMQLPFDRKLSRFVKYVTDHCSRN